MGNSSSVNEEKDLGDVPDPIPDELCLHVEMGAEMTGGWYFAAEEPPRAVGMCHECVVWCKENFDPFGQMPWSQYAAARG